MLWALFVLAGYLLLAIVVLLVLVRLYATFIRAAEPLWRPEQNTFVDPIGGQERVFPSVLESPSLYISLVVPAYKEQSRLPVMLDDTLRYLKARSSRDPAFTWEIIVVDDGSTDQTTPVALNYVKQEGCNAIRVLTLLQNRGKGGAVRRGVMMTRGRFILMLDADAATQISDVEGLERALQRVQRDELGIAVGSRAHMEDSAATANRALHRRFISWVFHMLVDNLCVRGVRDTQCGFKLFTRLSAARLFPNMHIERWAFDVELLFMAQQLGHPLVECPVNWEEIAGSTLDPLTASIQMARDLVRIRAMYMLGLWTLDRASNSGHPLRLTVDKNL